MTGIYSFSTDNSTPHLLRPDGVRERVVLHRRGQHRAGRAACRARPATPRAPAARSRASTTEGWKSRTGGETVAVTNADAHGGSFSLLTSNRTATFQGPAFDVTNVMFNGSRYVVSLWAKLAPGQPDTQLRVSLRPEARHRDRDLPHRSSATPPSPRTPGCACRRPTTRRWPTRRLSLYVESASGTPSFYIDDFSITFVPPAVAERDIPSVFQTVAAFFPIVGAAVIPADISRRAGVPAEQALQQHHVGQRHEVGRHRADGGELHLHAGRRARSPSPRPTTCTSAATRWSGTTRRRPGCSTTPTATR